MVRLHIYIDGKVQGVFFRKWLKSHAQKMGLTGWVRNLEDGGVEAEIEGEKDNLEDIIKKCRKGPVFAHVLGVQVFWKKAMGEFEGFKIIS